MSTTAKTTELVDEIAGVKVITGDEAKQLFDQRARDLLGMSGDEFREQYHAGTLADPSGTGATILTLMLHLVED